MEECKEECEEEEEGCKEECEEEGECKEECKEEDECLNSHLFPEFPECVNGIIFHQKVLQKFMCLARVCSHGLPDWFQNQGED